MLFMWQVVGIPHSTSSSFNLTLKDINYLIIRPSNEWLLLMWLHSVVHYCKKDVLLKFTDIYWSLWQCDDWKFYHNAQFLNGASYLMTDKQMFMIKNAQTYFQLWPRDSNQKSEDGKELFKVGCYWWWDMDLA